MFPYRWLPIPKHVAQVLGVQTPVEAEIDLIEVGFGNPVPDLVRHGVTPARKQTVQVLLTASDHPNALAFGLALGLLSLRNRGHDALHLIGPGGAQSLAQVFKQHIRIGAKSIFDRLLLQIRAVRQRLDDQAQELERPLDQRHEPGSRQRIARPGLGGHLGEPPEDEPLPVQEDQLEIVVGDHPCQPGRGSPQARTRRLQRALARKKQNSKRRAKTRRNLARHHGRVAAARRDFLHKLSHGQASRHRVIAMEDLGMNALKRSFLARSVHDAAWTQLRDMLTYKAESAGGSVVLVDPRGTSRRCSGCGREPGRPKTLRDRVHGCDGCGLVLDRDVNAARNVLQLVQGPGTGLRPRSVRVAA